MASSPSSDAPTNGPNEKTGKSKMRALERMELVQRRETTRRAIHRNAAQARGELHRGQPRRVLKVTALMLRGKSLKSLASPQIPLLYYRGRAFEELGDRDGAVACYRAVSAWDGGAQPLVEDAKEYIERSLRRLIALLGEAPSAGARITSPDRDPRAFPRPYLTPARLIIAMGVTFLSTICAGTLLAIF